jgi:hypothetical protein
VFQQLLKRFEQIIGSRSLVLPALVLLLNFALSLFTEFYTLHNFGYSTDEHAYLISAELMAEGRLSVPSPEPRDFFHTNNVLNNGRYYGKYPPGWPALLSLGVRMGATWVIAPLLGALSLGMIYAAARRHFSIEMANVSLLSMLCCPFFLFNSGSYFSHSACLAAAVLLLFATLEVLKEPTRPWPYGVLGLAFGLGFTIRPFTLLVLAVVPAIHLIGRAVRRKQFAPLLRGLPLAVAGASVGLIPFLAYNHALTGSALLQPFQVYDPTDSVSLPVTIQAVEWRFKTLLLDRLILLVRWFPQAPMLLLLAWTTRRLFADDHRFRWLVLGWAALPAAYLIYPMDGGWQYGPRYIYEAFPLLLLVSSAALLRIGRAAPLVLVLLVAFNVETFARRARWYSDEIAIGRSLYTQAAAPEYRGSIVFLNQVAPTMDADDSTRNGTHFDRPVLFVHDLGSRNSEILRRFPERKAFVYVFDATSSSGRIVPYGEKPLKPD